MYRFYMAMEKVIGNPTDSVSTIKRKFMRFNPNKKVTRVRVLKNIKALNGTIIAKSFRVTSTKK